MAKVKMVSDLTKDPESEIPTWIEMTREVSASLRSLQPHNLDIQCE